MIMFKKIENLTTRLVILPLNSGRTLYISPKNTSEDVLNVEVKDNSMVKRLRERGEIALHPVEERKVGRRPKKEKPAPAPGTGPAMEKTGKTKSKKEIKPKAKGGE
jgi:hypothetical protein